MAKFSILKSTDGTREVRLSEYGFNPADSPTPQLVYIGNISTHAIDGKGLPQ